MQPAVIEYNYLVATLDPVLLKNDRLFWLVGKNVPKLIPLIFGHLADQI